MDALEEAFAENKTDFYLIGAVARDEWFSRGGKRIIGTKDIDFAVLVADLNQYESLRKFLKEKKGFIETTTNQFVMLAPGGLQVDILPFGGEMEIDDAVKIEGPGLNTVHVNGFQEVFERGTEEVELSTGHRFKIATLPSIILLKIIAFDDRPEKRGKDARDIGVIVRDFFDLQTDLVYSHSDLYLKEELPDTMVEIAAVVIGREIRKIIGSNEKLLDRVRSSVEKHIGGEEKSPFIKNMMAATGNTVEETIVWLSNLMEGLTGS